MGGQATLIPSSIFFFSSLFVLGERCASFRFSGVPLVHRKNMLKDGGNISLVRERGEICLPVCHTGGQDEVIIRTSDLSSRQVLLRERRHCGGW